ncbi:beta-3 adrenergic receptor-like [Acanthaster planci]|uniref:Beta-3 adrenergic receptor-like n=1 Tax=Acanthaster planci TaxID=133434 RepID=A0A8B7ZJ75_ACAPL|nr:beta-3 adrenergic receptor-like [Acanthaster planci]
MTGMYGNSTSELADNRAQEDAEGGLAVFVVQCVSLSFAAFVAVFGNGATIVAFICDSGLRDKPSNLLILALSCSDLCVGFVITSITLSTFFVSWTLGELGCRFVISVGDLIVPLGPLLVAAICLDRYLLISRDYPRYLAIQTRRRVRLTIALCWLLTAVLCTTENILWDVAPVDDTDFTRACTSPSKSNLQFQQFSNIVYALIPFSFVTGCSVRFLVLLRRKLKGHRRVGPRTVSAQVRWAQATTPRQPSTEFLSPTSLSESNEPSTCTAHREDNGVTRLIPPVYSPDTDSPSQLLRSRYVRPIITVICLVAALAVCYMPYCIYFLFVVTLCPSCNSPNLFTTFHLLRLFNSCLDPILYAATQRRIRTFYGKQFRRLSRHIRSSFRRRFRT